MIQKKQGLCFIVFLAFVLTIAYTQENNKNSNYTEVDQLFLSDTAFLYGEASFKSRILQKQGERPEAIGLVLSGGSARAFAHLGVLRRMEEASIVPDFIVTNSMGSIVGLLYAAGLSPDQIEELIVSSDLSSLFEPVLPLYGGLLDTSRFSSLLKSIMPNLRLEDMPIPILVACEDLRTKRAVYIMEGDFITVLQASFALPVYFPPVEYRGHLLIDGGISNLVPLGLAMKYSNKVIVSSTFYDAKGLNLYNPLVVLNVAIDINKQRAGVKDILEYPEALWVRCDVENYSFMAFDKISDLLTAGYNSMDRLSSSLELFGMNGPGQELIQKREQWAYSLKKASKSWQPFSRASAQFSVGLSPKLQSLAWPGDSFYLSSDLLFAIAGYYNQGPLDLSLSMGTNWDAYYSHDFYPALAIEAAMYLTPWLRLTSLAYANSSEWPEKWTFYHRSAIETAFFLNFGKIKISSALEEVYKNSQSKLLSNTFNYAFKKNYSKQPELISSLSFSLGHQLEQWTDNALWAGLNGTSRLFGPIELEWNNVSRIMLDVTKKSSLYLSETMLADFLQLYEDAGSFSMANSISIVIAPNGFSLSFAELLILRNIRLATLVEGLWSYKLLTGNADQSALPVAMATGISMNCDLAFIGLKKAGLWMDLVLEIFTNKPIFRVYFNI